MIGKLLHPDPIPDLIAWGEARSGVRAMLLTSTRAIPGAPVDVLSDYDVILIVEEIKPFVLERAWLNDFGEPLIVYWDPVYPDPLYGLDVCANVTQYEAWLRIDFTLWPVALLERIVAAADLPAELDAGYRVLLDKDGLTAALRPPTGRAYLPRRPTAAEYQLLVNDFLTDAPYVAKCLWRDELLPAKWALDHDMKHVYLRPLLEWRSGMEHDWAVPVGALGKGLKKLLPPQIWAGVEAAYGGADPTDNWDALARTMEIFRQVAVEVGDYLGYEYPHPLHERVWNFVERVRQLPPPESTGKNA